MRLTILGGGGFRVPLVHRALLADEGPGAGHRPRAARRRPRPAAAPSAAVLADAERAAGRPGRGCTSRPTSTTAAARRRLRLLRDPGRRPGRAGVRRARRARPRACSARRPPAPAASATACAPSRSRCGSPRPCAGSPPTPTSSTSPTPPGWSPRRCPACSATGSSASATPPSGMFKRVARALDVDPARAVFDYAGLNHLGWLRRVLVDGTRPAARAARRPRRRCSPPRRAGCSGRTGWRRSAPCPTSTSGTGTTTRTRSRPRSKAGRTRGELLLRQQRDFWAHGAGGRRGGAFARWERAGVEREATYMADSREATGAGEREQEDLDGGGYDRVALAADARGRPRRARPRSCSTCPTGDTLAGLDTDAVVEVPCVVDANGWRPSATDPLDPHAAGLVATVKAVERTTIEAALSGSYATADQGAGAAPAGRLGHRRRAASSTPSWPRCPSCARSSGPSRASHS